MGNQHSEGSLTLERRAWLLGLLHRNLGEYFAHWEDSDFPRDKLDNVYLGWIEEGLSIEERSEFVLFLYRCIAKLRNRHSRVLDTSPLAANTRFTLGFSIEKIEEQWVVFESEVQGIKPGFVVEQIDERTPAEWMEELSDLLVSSKAESRETEWQRLLPMILKPDRVTINVVDLEGNNCEISYSLHKLNNDKAQSSMKHNLTDGKWIVKEKVGYIRIPSFSEPSFEEGALEYLNKFIGARCIIIDVRGNDGGSTPVKLMEALLDRPFRWWMETSSNASYLSARHSDDQGQLTVFEDGSGAKWESDYMPPTGCIYNGNLTILIDRKTISAAEDFVMPFKDTGRATLIGETTVGSTGQPFVWSYDSIYFFIGAVRTYMPSGESFEGVGITPDIKVKRTRDDIITGKDPVLEKAIHMIQ